MSYKGPKFPYSGYAPSLGAGAPQAGEVVCLYYGAIEAAVYYDCVTGRK